MEGLEAMFLRPDRPVATVTNIPVKNYTETIGHKKEKVGENSQVVLKHNSTTKNSKF